MSLDDDVTHRDRRSSVRHSLLRIPHRDVSPVASTTSTRSQHDSRPDRNSLDIEMDRMAYSPPELSQPFHPTFSQDLGDGYDSHQTLLPAYATREVGQGTKNEASANINRLQTFGDDDRAWRAGVVQRLPWRAILALIGVLTCISLCIVILVISDGDIQERWTIQPSVYLAVLAPLGNILLQYVLSQGLVTAWWTLALRKTSLTELHNRWEHGTSILSAATSMQGFDKVAAAKLLIASTFAVNPLLQRASRTVGVTVARNATIPFQLATNRASFANVGLVSASEDSFSDPVQLSPAMVSVMRDYTNRSPILNAFGDCTGNCTGTVRAAGIVSNCSRFVNETFGIKWGNGAGPNVTVFETGTNVMSYQTGRDFNLSVTYIETTAKTDGTSEYGGESGPAGTLLPKEQQDCDGTLTRVTCGMQHAVLEYPITLRDNTITVQTRPSDARVIQTEETGLIGDVDPEIVFNGLSIAANSITSSTGATEPEGKYGWYFQTSGPLTAFYLQSGDLRTCEMKFADPTDDILTSFNEIMFRISLAAFNTTSANMSLATNYTLTQEAHEIQYESRYVYLVAATAISLLACASLLPTFHGFWDLGREFSLSPVEIAKAFDAPLLRTSEQTNMPIHRLLEKIGPLEVQYGVSPTMHLKFAAPEEVGTPSANLASRRYVWKAA